MEIVKNVFELVKDFPEEERYGFRSQHIGSLVSVAAKIPKT